MSDLTDFGTIVTIIAGFATAGGLIFVGYQTLMLRNERNLTLRAWIGIGNPAWINYGFVDDDGKFISIKKYATLSQEEKNKFQNLQKSIEIKNYGQIPAENLKARQRIITGYLPTKKDIDEIPFYTISTMMPSSSLHLFHTFSKSEREIIKDLEGEIYFIWEVEYESPKGKKKKHGEIIQFSQEIYAPIESWDEDD